MLLILCIPVVSYLLFVFVSETTNPFSKVKSPLRKPHWRLGRSIGIASLVSGFLSVYLLYAMGLNPRLVLALYIAMTVTFVLPSLGKFKRTRVVL